MLNSLAAMMVFMISACSEKTLWVKQGEVNSKIVQTTPLSLAQKPVATKIINHALGQVEIPLHPQRIVVLDDRGFLIETLLLFGIKPVGVLSCSACVSSDIVKEFRADVPVVGDDLQPSLEKVLSLKPDLILGYYWRKDLYPLLSAIAPTVLIDSNTEHDFKRTLKYLAEVLDRSDQAEEFLTQYDERIQKFRRQFGEKLKTKTVSLLSFYNSTFHADKPEILGCYAQVMSDAGIQFIPALKNLENDTLRLSLETLPDWDADFLFIQIYLKRDFEDPKSLSLFEEPIWLKLSAVRNKQVFIMSWPGGGGPMLANQVIDELHEYFIKKL
jgi:iron complex transport system substrate-binding protein